MPQLTQKQIECVLVQNMSNWDTDYFTKGPNAVHRIKEEIAFYGWDQDIEAQIINYVDHNYDALVEKVLKQQAQAALKNLQKTRKALKTFSSRRKRSQQKVLSAQKN
ncbi:hypothetical protein L0152_19940 [bacterium]|nr:hypothetical protein [bacterium]